MIKLVMIQEIVICNNIHLFYRTPPPLGTLSPRAQTVTKQHSKPSDLKH